MRSARGCATDTAMTRGRLVPVMTVLLAIVAVCTWPRSRMNAQWERDQAARAEVTLTLPDLVARTLVQERPVLPAPHQVAGRPVGGAGRSGHHLAPQPGLACLGDPVRDAGRLCHRHQARASCWRSASSTAAAWTSRSCPGPWPARPFRSWPSRRWSSWSCPAWVSRVFCPRRSSPHGCRSFPVLVGMVKGLRTPDAMQLDQMRSWSASNAQVFGGCGCRRRCPTCSPASRSRSPRRWSAPSWRTARRGDRGPWRAAAVGQLLRPDRPDLVGAVRRGPAGRGPCGHRRMLERRTLSRMGLAR